MTTTMFLLATIATAGCVGFAIWAAKTDWMNDWQFAYIALSTVCGIAALALWIIAISIPISAGYDKRQCYRYGNLTGREVKYQRFSYWTWDCYVRTKSGNWISRNQVRGVDQ